MPTKSSGVPSRPSRQPVHDGAHSRLIQSDQIICINVARCNGVYIDSTLGPFIAECLGELGDTALARRVGRNSKSTAEAGHRGGIDDFAIPFL